MCFKYLGEFILLTFNHKTSLLHNSNSNTVIFGKYSCKNSILCPKYANKKLFWNNSQLHRNSQQVTPERKLIAIGYQQLQSSNSPAGGAVAHLVAEVQHLKGGYLELHGGDPRQIKPWKLITPQGFAKYHHFELPNNL